MFQINNLNAKDLGNIEKNKSCPMPVSAERLKVVNVSYYDFDMKERHDGKIMVLDAAAQQVKEIFQELFRMKFPLAKVRLIDDYKGSDDLSMADNNTSSFNCREISNSPGVLSIHSYGLAIDINTVQNPYIVFNEHEGVAVFYPKSSIRYANRAKNLSLNEGKGFAEHVVQIFKSHGFTIWGGDWNDPIDYQHFQVSRKIADILAELSPEQAKEFFSCHVKFFNKHNKEITEALENVQIKDHKVFMEKVNGLCLNI